MADKGSYPPESDILVGKREKKQMSIKNVLDSFQDAYILYLNISESRTHLIIGDI
jgi:hypothetical protein